MVCSFQNLIKTFSSLGLEIESKILSLLITSSEPVPSARGLASLAPAYSTDSQLAGGFAPWTTLVGADAPPYLCLTIILYLSNTKYYLKINYTFSFFLKLLDTESNLHPNNSSPCFISLHIFLFIIFPSIIIFLHYIPLCYNIFQLYIFFVFIFCLFLSIVILISIIFLFIIISLPVIIFLLIIVSLPTVLVYLSYCYISIIIFLPTKIFFHTAIYLPLQYIFFPITISPWYYISNLLTVKLKIASCKRTPRD